MSVGRKYLCNNCGHEWGSRTRGGAPAHCPNCNSSNFGAEDSAHVKKIETLRAITGAELAEAERNEAETNKIFAEEQRKSNEFQRLERQRGIAKFGIKEYEDREGLVLSAKLSESEKSQLCGLISKVDKNGLIKEIKHYETSHWLKASVRYSLWSFASLSVLLFIVIPLIIGLPFFWQGNQENLVVSSLEDCSYKEISETGSTINVLYDKGGGKYLAPLTFSSSWTDAGSWCWAYLDIKNEIDKLVATTIQYKLIYCVGGACSWSFKNETLELLPFETRRIEEGLELIRATCGIEVISTEFNPNNETYGIVENETNETCKKCGSVTCLNDGAICKMDSQCGSGICNIAGICGKERIINCPTGKINIDSECADNLPSKFKKNYFMLVGMFFFVLVAVWFISVYLIADRRKRIG